MTKWAYHPEYTVGPKPREVFYDKSIKVLIIFKWGRSPGKNMKKLHYTVRRLGILYLRKRRANSRKRNY